MMGQQSLLMTLANVVPRAPELPTGPVAGQPVVPPPVPHGQPQEVWDVDAVSRDASDAEPLFEEGTEPEVTSQHSEQDDPEVLDTNDPMWSVVERAARHLGVDWPASEPTRRSLFELPSAHTLQSRILPAFPDFIKEVQSTWGAPASTPATSRKAAAFNMHGASEAGLASFPPVGAAFAALVKAPTLSGLAKDPSCPNRQCRITEAHLKKGYAAATEAVRLSNVASLLTVYQAALLRDLPECPSAALRTELGTVAQLLVKLAQLNARAQGRSIASLVVARRQLWLSQARVQEPDKVPLLDAPISPGHTFGPAVEEMLQRSVKAREASQQLAKMWPSKPFQPRRPQERQWRRAPPQQQAQSRGSMTAPSGVSARGQPAFVRPQRGGWRPRGGGKPRPRGSGQAPRNRGCIRNLEDCVACLGPEHAASALADRLFCALCTNFQPRTLRQRARKVVGSHSPSSGSSFTLSVPPSSTATPAVALRGSRSPSQLTSGQRSPDRRRAHERSHSPSIRPRGSSPRRERSRRSRSRSLSPRRRGRSRSPRRDRRREKSGVAEHTSKMSQFMEVMMGQQSLLMSLTNRALPAEVSTSHSAFQPQPLAVPVVQQPQGAWNVDAISRDASEGEPLLEEDSPGTDLASQHSKHDSESEALDTSDPLWSLVERATRHLGIEWQPVELP
ncbi:UNVERIFIED_CONTAM: hypothetical protein FKN15_038034 [Acipenser sinensis]